MPRQDETLLTHVESRAGALAPGQTLSASMSPMSEHNSLEPGPDGPSSPAHAGSAPEDRYIVLSLLGHGGMGEVYRVRDRVLDRTIALKVVRGDQGPSRIVRFGAEARLTAQLQHPGIVPVHDFGTLPDGRLFFTMREIDGRTFTTEIQRLHDSGPARFAVRLRRLIDAFRRACEAVAYAHDAGILHRDIKPDNLMVGAFGEVVVVDWGLGQLVAPDERGERRRIEGTPRYMAPEQARGEPLGPGADVWALGLCLRQILFGRPPTYDVSDDGKVLHAVGLGLLPDPPRPAGRNIPADLLDLVHACLRQDPSDRPPDAGVLVSELADWLDGAQRRERGLAMVAAADDAFARSRELEDEAATHAARAEQILADLADDAPVTAREPAWDLEDTARNLLDQADRARRDGERGLRAALSHDADLAEAHERLADRAHARHRALEDAGRFIEARRLEPLLVDHGRGRFDRYLHGVGALTLHTEPPGARATLYRYVARRRRLVPQRVAELGPTPLVNVPLEQGSYLVTLDLPGRRTVLYPVFIRRLEHWDGIPPDGTEPLPIPLPATLREDEIYVPAGWFTSESENLWASHQLPRRRLWCDGFVIGRDNITVRAYLAYLDALAAAGDAEALALALPKDRGRPVVALQAGRHVPVPDEEGDVYDLDWPMISVTWHQSVAYAAWRARRDAQPWRLPFELEFEKAARGVDERLYPWGQDFDPSFSKSAVHLARSPGPAPIASSPVDTSPYGVRDTAGNVATWTLDPWPDGVGAEGARVRTQARPVAQMMVGRGGSWNFNAEICQSNSRTRGNPGVSRAHLGLRLVRPV